MRPIGFVILFCLVLSSVANAAGPAPEVKTLKIVDKRYDLQTRQLEYELWNESAKTVTAWRLSLARSDSHGHAQRSVLDQDFFEREPAASLGSRSGPIAPGGSVTAQWHLEVAPEDSGPSALSLKVSAVVFEDLTWEGDGEAAAAILEARSARVEAIGTVLADLEREEARPGSRRVWSAALKQRAQLLRRQGNEPDPSVGGRREVAAVLSATRLELAQWLDDASREISLAPDPHEALGFLTASLREQYEVGLRAVGVDVSLDNTASAQAGGER